MKHTDGGASRSRAFSAEPHPHFCSYLRQAALDSHQKMIADKLAIAELATTGVVALPPVVPIGQLLDVLRSCNHQVNAYFGVPQ